MIESTFLHLPRVGVPTEQALWHSGIRTWNDFLSQVKAPRFTSEKKRTADSILRESQRALRDGNSAFFRSLPSCEQWRLWPQFSDEAVFVDIETSWRGDITVLGVYNGVDVHQFVKGKNLTPQAIKAHLQGKLIVTYNGASFDLPVIRKYFGAASIPAVPHFDTMHLARRLGYRGGLKILERSLDIKRPDELTGLSGQDALHLWELYRASGDERQLQTLLAYNEEDIVNLPVVARKLVAQAIELQRNHLQMKTIKDSKV